MKESTGMPKTLLRVLVVWGLLCFSLHSSEVKLEDEEIFAAAHSWVTKAKSYEFEMNLANSDGKHSSFRVIRDYEKAYVERTDHNLGVVPDGVKPSSDTAVYDGSSRISFDTSTRKSRKVRSSKSIRVATPLTQSFFWLSILAERRITDDETRDSLYYHSLIEKAEPKRLSRDGNLVSIKFSRLPGRDPGDYMVVTFDRELGWFPVSTKSFTGGKCDYESVVAPSWIVDAQGERLVFPLSSEMSSFPDGDKSNSFNESLKIDRASLVVNQVIDPAQFTEASLPEASKAIDTAELNDQIERMQGGRSSWVWIGVAVAAGVLLLGFFVSIRKH